MTRKLEAPEKVSSTCRGWSGEFVRKDHVGGWAVGVGAAWQAQGSGSLSLRRARASKLEPQGE